ncbi:unnamed protein product, partial [marine sediment metagenome]
DEDAAEQVTYGGLSVQASNYREPAASVDMAQIAGNLIKMGASGRKIVDFFCIGSHADLFPGYRVDLKSTELDFTSWTQGVIIRKSYGDGASGKGRIPIEGGLVRPTILAFRWLEGDYSSGGTNMLPSYITGINPLIQNVGSVP